MRACVVPMLLLAGWLPGHAASGPRALEAGLPAVQAFSPADYGGGGQNWAVVQDRRGLIYVGNGDDGVMEFDGVRWRRIPLPNPTVVRSLAVGADGRVYVGAQGEMGYLAPDPRGALRYVSLMPGVQEDERRFADVSKTFAIKDDIYFFTAQRVFRVRAGQVRSWKFDTPHHLAFAVRERLFVRAFDKGLLELVDDQFRPVPGGERFAQEKIYAMLPWTPPGGVDAGHILIGTRTQGWILFDGKYRYARWTTQADQSMPGDLLYDAERLAGGGIAMGTLQGGLVILERDGSQRLRLGRETGLGDDTVFAIKQDRQHGLWLGLGAGVARVSAGNPLSRFEPRNGLVGTVLSIQRHAGMLYVGTTSGLFELETRPGASARFSQVPGIPSLAWTLLDLGDALLIASIKGVFELRDGVVRPIPLTDSAISLLRSTLDPSRVFIGTGGGLQAIRRGGDGRWVKEALDLTTGSGIYSLVEDERGRLWMAQAESVYRLDFPGIARGDALPVPRQASFGVADGLVPGMTTVYSIGGAPAFATNRGLLRFDEASSRFVPAPEFKDVFADGARRIGALREDSKGRVWMYSQNDALGLKEVGVATRAADGRFRWDASRFQPTAGLPYLAIQVEDDGVVWFGGETLLYRYDPSVVNDADRPFSALIRKVSGRNNGVFYGGAGPQRPLQLPSNERSLRFEYAAPSYDTMKANRYQVMLEGVDQEWSAWSAEGYRDYTTLPTGRHRFRVRARNVHGTVSAEAMFEVDLLPPWYLTWWAYLAYGLLAVGTVVAAVRGRSAALLRRNLELAALVDRRTGELSEAVGALREQSVTDPLTGLKNRRYVLDHIGSDIAQVDRAYAKLADGERAVNADLLFLLLDIDHFKQVNDQHGHAAGDRVLEQIRDLLLKVSRKVDTPVRWGGEEFLMIARNVDTDGAIHLAERLRSAVANHEFDLGNGEKLYRTCSVGFAAYPFFQGAPQRLGWEQVVEIADQCLYEAKHCGRNTWVGAHAAVPRPPDDIETRLRAGIGSMAADGVVGLRIFGE